MSEIEKQMMIVNVLKNVEIGLMVAKSNDFKKDLIEKSIKAVRLIENDIPVSIETLERR